MTNFIPVGFNPGMSLASLPDHYQGMTLPWMRWWDLENNMLLTGAEGMVIAQAEKLTAQLKTQKAQEAQAQTAQADRLAAKLRELGIDPIPCRAKCLGVPSVNKP